MRVKCGKQIALDTARAPARSMAIDPRRRNVHLLQNKTRNKTIVLLSSQRTCIGAFFVVARRNRSSKKIQVSILSEVALESGHSNIIYSFPFVHLNKNKLFYGIKNSLFFSSAYIITLIMNY